MLTFEEALKAALEFKKDINFCYEYADYYAFCNSDNVNDTPITVDIDCGDVDDVHYSCNDYYDEDPVTYFPVDEKMIKQALAEDEDIEVNPPDKFSDDEFTIVYNPNTEKKKMDNNSIEIQKISIVDLDTDAIVNAANSGLQAGSGVCGAIFEAAGYRKLQAACNAIGHCHTGSAVITPGFNLKAKYVIHAVGPIWHGGQSGEEKLLYGAYHKSLELAAENSCHSIGFPLISTGVFHYPREKAWKTAIQACHDFFRENPDACIKVVFAILNDGILAQGKQILEEAYKKAL